VPRSESPHHIRSVILPNGTQVMKKFRAMRDEDAPPLRYGQRPV
jgi:hypothetical protein